MYMLRVKLPTGGIIIIIGTCTMTVLALLHSLKLNYFPFSYKMVETLINLMERIFPQPYP